MNRRKFLTMFKAAPLIAVPTVTVSALAMAKSEKAVEKINDIALNGNQNVISNCTFTMNGNLQLTGDYQTITSCMFEMNQQYEGMHAISVKGKDSSELMT